MKQINVHIGEVKTGKRGDILQAILGSCVGIGLIWRERNICGLAHCLLPEAPKESFQIDGRFVTQAIPSLIALMRIKHENMGQIEAIIAGGGNMTNPSSTDDDSLVGTVNYKVAERELKNRGIRIIHMDCAGKAGRKIRIDTSDFTFKVEKIPRIVSSPGEQP